jgi:Na+/H+-dicarboxylate symporter
VGGAGLPSGASFFAPIVTMFMAVGLPVEVIPVLFAVDTIPDMGQTVANVTSDMAAVTIVEKGGPVV